MTSAPDPSLPIARKPGDTCLQNSFYGVFEEKIRLGANSVVGQPLWIVRPKSDVLAYRLELLIGSVDQTVWRAVAIVNLVAEVHNKEEEHDSSHKSRLERMAQWLASRV